MEIPDLIKQRLGGEEIESAVNLGDEDLVCFTPTRTLLYRAEGILSDESISVYDHDVERLDVSSGRRKTSFELEYLDRTESFTIASGRAEPVLKRLLAGILHTSEVTDDGESVVDVFRFSELTLVVTESRLIKHIGTSVWDEDYAEYPFENVTGLEFEDGSVATQLVLSVDGRPQRIKAPSDQARVVRDTLERALFAYHDVESLDQLNTAVGEPDADESDGNESGDLSFGDTITPLVTEEDDEPETKSTADRTESADVGADIEHGTAQQESTTETDNGEKTGGFEGNGLLSDTPASDTSTEPSGDTSQESTEPTDTASSPADGSARGHTPQAIDPDDIDAMQTQITKLTKAVEQQNELLKKQHDTINQLIEELRRREQ